MSSGLTMNCTVPNKKFTNGTPYTCKFIQNSVCTDHGTHFTTGRIGLAGILS